MDMVTAEQVNTLYKEMFFTKPKRLNLKVYSHAHEANKEKRKESQDINEKTYQKMEETFQTKY